MRIGKAKLGHAYLDPGLYPSFDYGAIAESSTSLRVPRRRCLKIYKGPNTPETTGKMLPNTRLRLSLPLQFLATSRLSTSPARVSSSFLLQCSIPGQSCQIFLLNCACVIRDCLATFSQFQTFHGLFCKMFRSPMTENTMDFAVD